MYEYDDYDDKRSRGRIAAVVVALVAAGIGWFVLRPALRDDRDLSSARLVFDTESSVPAGATVDTAELSTDLSAVAPGTNPVGPPGDTQSVSIEVATTSAVLSPTGAASTSSTTTTRTPTSSLTTSTSTSGVTETTLPDGRPISVTAVFTNDEITLTGAVPNDVAANRVLAFAREYRLTPAPIVNNVTIDSAAPADGGIRVVEHNAVHFAGDTDAITPEHAQQLDRIVAFINAFPNTRVHVIGNTDQHGEETRNFVISQRRAEAVVNYLVAQGNDPARLTTQPAGESNPLSTESSPAADALNRRTDYVIFGLLGD